MLKPSSKTSNWPLVYRKYDAQHKVLELRFGPTSSGDDWCETETGPKIPNGPLSEMKVSSLQGRIVSIEFRNTLREPMAMIQMYDPYKDALTVLFTERIPEPDFATFHEDILVYIEDEEINGVVILSASQSLMKPQ